MNPKQFHPLLESLKSENGPSWPRYVSRVEKVLEGKYPGLVTIPFGPAGTGKTSIGNLIHKYLVGLESPLPVIRYEFDTFRQEILKGEDRPLKDEEWHSLNQTYFEAIRSHTEALVIADVVGIVPLSDIQPEHPKHPKKKGLGSKKNEPNPYLKRGAGVITMLAAEDTINKIILPVVSDLETQEQAARQRSYPLEALQAIFPQVLAQASSVDEFWHLVDTILSPMSHMGQADHIARINAEVTEHLDHYMEATNGQEISANKLLLDTLDLGLSHSQDLDSDFLLRLKVLWTLRYLQRDLGIKYEDIILAVNRYNPDFTNVAFL